MLNFVKELSSLDDCRVNDNFFKESNNLTPVDAMTVVTPFTLLPRLRSNLLFIQKLIHVSNKILSTLFYKMLTGGTTYTD